LDKAETEKMVARFLGATANFRIVEKPVQFCAGDYAITELVEHMELEGKAITLHGLDVKRFEGDRVVNEWQYANYVELLGQMGRDE
jgi:hypothetical protein